MQRHVFFKSVYYGVVCYVAKGNCYSVSNKKSVVVIAHYPISYLSMSSPQSLLGKTAFLGSLFIRLG